MPLRLRRSEKYKNFSFPVSYRIAEKGFMKDARNVYTNQNILETRHGISRWNSTAFSDILKSISIFKDNSDNNYILAKDGTILYKANATGAHTSLRTGLTSANKHRGVTFNNRHIVAIGSDGLFSYDGATFTQLGQSAPTGISVAAASGGSLPNKTWQVGVTFYDSGNGFESNTFESSEVATSGANNTLAVTSIPTSADNANIDKKRIYLKNVTDAGEFLFIAEIDLATASYNITDESTSTQQPPTKNGTPSAGGAKFLTVFDRSIAYAGNSTFPSDVFFSENYLPDAFDDTSTSKTINIAGNGPITGIATGYFNGDDQNPYLIAFKKRHIELFRYVAGSPQQVVISKEVGCVGHDTIQVINGDIFFMSLQGWHIISNGQLVKTKDKSNSIDNGHIDDIFTRSGFTYELNKSYSSNFFSVYYPTLRQYMTFISEGSNQTINKSYNFEFEIGGFRPYEFLVNFSDAELGEDSSGNDVVYLAGKGGYIYTHSNQETVGTDEDESGNSVAVSAFAQLWWTSGDDMDSSYNFGPFILRAISQSNPITIKYFNDYSNQDFTDLSYDFSATETGFILDVSKLDEGILSDGRQIVRYAGNIFKRGQTLLICFYKTQQGESMGLIEAQLDIQKNGNIN